MCEESYGDARERVEKNTMHDEETDWRHAYIGMEAAWKMSEEIIDALVAALEAAQVFVDTAVAPSTQKTVRDALALARGGK
ncbi:hypothetical protein [Mesorhizobium sp.]|uniref:hypothetical protein n=1 Tax=Mesorhizobium sp. TaxID=1871066 RepID=UPI000FE8997C|nr:hypothetical protein [Mesorhizobium sp.]RWO08257.1 MAG: hypothetical protein EOS15_30050 [Mesorhizobium sp.]